MQAFIAFSIVVAAGAYLAWRWMPAALRARLAGSSAAAARSGACDSCSSCGGCSSGEQTPREMAAKLTDGAQSVHFVRRRAPGQ
ncbi:MAG: hypothetical protein IAE92_02915 [Burkholderiaceae bacterium]|nr:hypothetical protein [Burkholderiaceae bacterium]